MKHISRINHPRFDEFVHDLCLHWSALADAGIYNFPQKKIFVPDSKIDMLNERFRRTFYPGLKQDD